MFVKVTWSFVFKGCYKNQETVQQAPIYKTGFPDLPRFPLGDAQLLLTAPMQRQGSSGCKKLTSALTQRFSITSQYYPPVLEFLVICSPGANTDTESPPNTLWIIY